MGNLNNLYISQSFQSLAHLGTDTALVPGTMTVLQDGIGQSLNIFFDGTNISSSGNLYAANITASVINTGSFATTGSNTFVGANIFSSSVDILGGLSLPINSLFVGQTNTTDGIFTNFVRANSGTGRTLILSGDTMASNGVTILNGLGVTGSVVISKRQVGMSLTGGDLDVAGTFTSSLQQGYIWVGDSTGKTTTVATSSLVPNINTGSLLLTASVSVNVLTFTKADGSTFDLTVAASGSVVPGTISGSAQITALGFVSSSVTASSLITASFNNGTRNLTFTKGDNTTFAVNIPDVSGSAGTFVTTSSFNAYTSSNDQRVGSLEVNSASVNVSITNLNASSASQQVSINALNVFTASQSTASLVTSIDNLNTFTASANIRLNNLESTSASVNTSISNINGFTSSANQRLTAIESVSGSWITESETGSFAITGSNTFIGNQTINGVLTVSSSATNDVVVNGRIFVSSSSTSGTGAPQIVVSGSQGQSIITRNSITINSAVVNQNAFANPYLISNYSTTTQDEIGFSVDASGANVLNWSTGPVIYVNNDPADSYNGVFGFQNKANYTDGRIAVLTPLSASAGFTASLQNGYIWVGNSLGENGQIATSSLATSAITASSLITASAVGNVITFTKGDASTFDVSVVGTSIDTASFATTGSNSFNGNQIITGSVFISSSIQKDLVVNGQVYISSSGTTGTTAPNLIVSGSQGTATIARNSITVRNLTYTHTMNPSLSDISNLTTTDAIGMTLDPVGAGVTGWSTGPTIYTNATNGTYPAVIGFQNIANYTDNRVSILTKLDAKSGLIVTGSTNFSGGITFTDRSGETSNVYLGLDALGMSTFGFQPLALGNTIAVAIGNGAMRYASGSNQNVAIGNNALLVTTGSKNVAIGSEALSSNTTGQDNFALGVSALTSNITGSFNVAIGNSALFYNQTDNQIAIGGNALKDTTTGWRNTAIGYSAAEKNTTGETNVAIGGYAMNAATGSENNIAIGYAAMESAQSTDFNTAIGVAALQNAKSNSNTNVAIGGNALRFHYDGDIEFGDNMAIGYDSMANMTSGSANVAIGTLSLRDPQRANENTFIGYLAAYNAQTGSNGDAFRLNVGIGSRTGQYSRGIENTFIGTYAGIEIREGNQNTFVGARAGINIITGSNNTLLGKNGGVNNWNNVIAISDGEGNIKFFNSGSKTTLTNNTLISGSLTVTGSTVLSGSFYIQSGSNLPNGTTDRVLTYDTTTGQVRQATLASILSASFDTAEFWSTTTQSGSAGVSGSVTFNNSGSIAGISLANNSRVTVSQAGTYNIQFSAQIETSAGADTVYIWFKKNGNNIADSATKVVLANNTAQVMTVNIFNEAVANDYYELAYENINGHATILAEAASGNIPAIPSVILTIQQIR